MIKKNLLGERLKEIIYAIPSFDDVDIRLSDAILPLLSTTRLMQGYNLSVFKYGVANFGYRFIPYVHRCGALMQWCPPEKPNYKSSIREEQPITTDYATGEYKDKYFIKGIWGYERDIASVPSILSYFELTFSEDGVFDAWVLYNLGDFLPKFWHANYGAKDFIYGIEVVDELFPEDYNGNSCFARERSTVKDAVRALDINELIPQVIINGDTAIFTCTYWSHFSGLYKMETTFERVDNHIQCVSQREICLVSHRSDIMF